MDVGYTPLGECGKQIEQTGLSKNLGTKEAEEARPWKGEGQPEYWRALGREVALIPRGEGYAPEVKQD